MGEENPGAGRYALACLVAGGAWIVAEVAGGLAFLGAGIRLWRYEFAPLIAQITSPVVWIFALVLIVPMSRAFDRRLADGLSGRSRLAARVAFLMVVGPAMEILVNEGLFKGIVGRPLYEYLVLPLLGGSSSILSPLYYSTLIIHVPLTDQILPPSPFRGRG
jgi:hypothetical protein